uniref:Uncharacterized protein n=1 Tax=Anguilla anguilla TaxID=7936 RepID=A0A0E9VK82_ANGAN
MLRAVYRPSGSREGRPPLIFTVRRWAALARLE